MDLAKIGVFLRLEDTDEVIELGTHNIDDARKLVDLLSSYQVKVLSETGGKVFEYSEPTLVYEDGKFCFEVFFHQVSPAVEIETDEY